MSGVIYESTPNLDLFRKEVIPAMVYTNLPDWDLVVQIIPVQTCGMPHGEIGFGKTEIRFRARRSQIRL
jgi:hypothetical protein